MVEGIKRMVERYLCGKLGAKMPGHLFLAMSGGGEHEDAVDVEPPFTVITVNSAEKVMSEHGVWTIQGSAQTITHMGEATPTVHSQLSRVIYEALANIQPEAGEKLILHGIDVTGHRSTEEAGEKIRVDAIDFVAGVSG